MNIFKKAKKVIYCLVGSDGTKPTYSDAHSAGMDLYASEPVIIPAHSSAVIPTSFYACLDKGTFGMVRGRSGLAFKRNIICFDGTIDCGYSGEIKGLLFNMGDEDYLLKKGDRFAQLVVVPYDHVTLKKVYNMDTFLKCFDFNRGGGFGHSGK